MTHITNIKYSESNINELKSFYDKNKPTRYSTVGYGEITNSISLQDGEGNLSTYVIECDFPFYDEIKAKKADMIRQYELHKLMSNGWDYRLYNFPYENEEFANWIYEKYYNVLNKNFYLPLGDRWENYIKNFPNIYVQTNKITANECHNHIHTGCTISTVCYIDLPKTGGKLKFFFGKEEVVMNINIDKLYLFPSWLYHMPMPHDENITRVAINTDFVSEGRPRLKISEDQW